MLFHLQAEAEPKDRPKARAPPRCSRGPEDLRNHCQNPYDVGIKWEFPKIRGSSIVPPKKALVIRTSTPKIPTLWKLPYRGYIGALWKGY